MRERLFRAAVEIRSDGKGTATLRVHWWGWPLLVLWVLGTWWRGFHARRHA